MKSSVLLTFIFLLSCFSLFAGDFYIMQDPNCMDKFVYRDNLNNELVKYSYRLNDNERLFLQVGPENQARIINYLPSNAFRCGNSFISTDLAKILQNSSNNVYIVKPEAGNTYRMLKVNSFDYYNQNGSFATFVGQQYRFSFSPNSVTGANDLSNNDPRGTVKFEGNINYGCAQALLFKQRPGISPTSFIDIIFVPQIGVVEQASQQAYNSIKLHQVNSEPINTFIQRFCNGNGITDEFKDRGVVINYDNPAVINTTPTNNNSTANTAKYHIVEKNQTLFGLSRKYNISIDNLRRWNGMGANETLLREGTKLRVSNFEQTVANNNFNNGIIQYETPVVQNPQNNNNEFRSRAGTPAWQTTTGTHVVRPGESINSIAALYGYTPDRFRAFNNLSPNTQVFEGQVLSTLDCDNTTATNTTNTGTSYNYNNLSPNLQNNQQVDNFRSKSPANNTNNNQPGQPGQPNNYDTYIYYNGGNTQTQPGFQQRGSNNQANLSTNIISAPNTNTTANTNVLSIPKTNESENLFEPYNYDSGTELNSNTTTPNINNSNFNVSPSELNNINTRRPPQTRSLGTPVPNTAAPQVQPNTNNRANFDSPVPGANFNSPVPGVNPGSVGNSNPNINNNNTTNNSGVFNRGGAKRITHVVQQGETIESIARKYSISLDRLLQLNNMQKGQKVLPKHKIFLN